MAINSSMANHASMPGTKMDQWLERMARPVDLIFEDTVIDSIGLDSCTKDLDDQERHTKHKPTLTLTHSGLDWFEYLHNIVRL